MGKAILNEKQGSLVLALFGLPFVLARDHHDGVVTADVNAAP